MAAFEPCEPDGCKGGRRFSRRQQMRNRARRRHCVRLRRHHCLVLAARCPDRWCSGSPVFRHYERRYNKVHGQALTEGFQPPGCSVNDDPIHGPSVEGVFRVPRLPTSSLRPSFTVSVGHMDFDYLLTEDDLLEVFGKYGSAIGVELDEGGGSATVSFCVLAEAQAAMSGLNGKVLDGLGGTLMLGWLNQGHAEDTIAAILVDVFGESYGFSDDDVDAGVEDLDEELDQI